MTGPGPRTLRGRVHFHVLRACGLGAGVGAWASLLFPALWPLTAALALGWLGALAVAVAGLDWGGAG